jgi:hypothetical protein
MKKFINIGIRIVISGGILVFVLNKIEFKEVLKFLQGMNYLLLGGAFLVYWGMVCVSAFRWYRLIKLQQVKLSYWRVLLYYFIGFFYNNILPTTIGCGVVRAFYAGRIKQKQKETFSSMCVELAIGGWGLILFALITSIIWFKGIPKEIFLGVVGGTIFSSLVIIVFFERKIMRIIKKGLDKIKLKKISEKLKEFYEALYVYKDNKWKLGETVLLSFVVQMLIGVMNILIGKALGLKLPVMSYIVYSVIIGLLTTLPITINGIGLREWGYQVLFGYVGLGSEGALTLAFLFYIVGVIGSLVGGIMVPFVKIIPEGRKNVQEGSSTCPTYR